MDILRNLPVQQPAALRELISIQPGRVVSMALSRSEHCQMSAWAQGIVWLSRRRPPTPLAGAAPSNCCKLPSNQTEEDLYGTVDQKPAPCTALSPEGSGRVRAR